MASTAETGHAINLGNFDDLTSKAKGMGTKYVPANAALKVANMQTQYTAAAALHKNVGDTRYAVAVAINGRQVEFEDFKPTATQVTNMFEVMLPNDTRAIADLRALNAKIQGSRTKKVVAAGLTQKTISASQQSFDQQVQHMKDLIAFLQQYPTYVPNEANLTVAAMQAELARMQATNAAMNPVETAYQNALIARNVAFYDPQTGLVRVAALVKKYVKGVYKANAPEYKVFSGIPFRTIKDK